jgi:hypothetical protein
MKQWKESALVNLLHCREIGSSREAGICWRKSKIFTLYPYKLLVVVTEYLNTVSMRLIGQVLFFAPQYIPLENVKAKDDLYCTSLPSL